MIKTKKLFFLNILLFLTSSIVNASVSVGTIDNTYKYAKICQEVSCVTHGTINFKPTINSSTIGATTITISDTAITGHAWGNQAAWVNLAPTTQSIQDVLKVNPATGEIKGKAYSSVGSWINFNPTGGGVFLVDNGNGSNFFGWAWASGNYGGWVKFDCNDSAACVKTDWRVEGKRNQVAPPGGSGGSLLVVNQNNINTTPTPATTPAPNETENTTKQKEAEVQTQTTLFERALDQIIKNENSEESATTAQDTGVNQSSPTEVTSTIQAQAGQIINPADPVTYSELITSYKEISPTTPTNYVKEECFFCVVVRKETAIKTDQEGNKSVVKENKVLKIGIIPKQMEVLVDIPFQETETKIDVVSAGTTTVSGWMIVRYLILAAVRRLLTGNLV